MTRGVVYVAFGEKAKEEARKSIVSMETVGVDLPVASIGDVTIPGATPLLWSLQSPFHGSGQFSFCAGEVKPFLAELSPFENTLYLDVDTIIKKNFTAGFDYLQDNDICVSYHTRKTGEMWFVD